MTVGSGLLALLAVPVIEGLMILAGHLANSNTFPQPIIRGGRGQVLGAAAERGGGFKYPIRYALDNGFKAGVGYYAIPQRYLN